MQDGFSIRHEVRPGDIGRIVLMHAQYYWPNHRFNEEFEAYVAKPLAELVLRKSNDERLWIVEHYGTVKGCIALAKIDKTTAQLRWYYLEPELRGKGIGRALITGLISFARERSYERVILWTVDTLWDAIRTYERNGFKKTERKEHRLWGLELVEEMYELTL